MTRGEETKIIASCLEVGFKVEYGRISIQTSIYEPITRVEWWKERPYPLDNTFHEAEFDYVEEAIEFFLDTRHELAIGPDYDKAKMGQG